MHNSFHQLLLLANWPPGTLSGSGFFFCGPFLLLVLFACLFLATVCGWVLCDSGDADFWLLLQKMAKTVWCSGRFSLCRKFRGFYTQVNESQEFFFLLLVVQDNIYTNFNVIFVICRNL